MKTEDVKYIVIHCAATRPHQDVDIETIDKWHKAQGFKKVGYHYVIKRDGTVQVGRQLNEQGAHVGKEFNHCSIGICLVGGVNDDLKPEANFTELQMNSLTKVLIQLQYEKGYMHCDIIGHHALNPNKACPSFNVKYWLDTGKVLTSSKG